MEVIVGFFSSWLIFAGILGLHLLLPARHVTGYVEKDGTDELLSYRLNGPLVLTVSISIWCSLGFSGLIPWDWMWHNRWYGFVGAITLGLLISLLVVTTAPNQGKP